MASSAREAVVRQTFEGTHTSGLALNGEVEAFQGGDTVRAILMEGATKGRGLVEKMKG